MDLFPDDWATIFALETPLLELVARGTVLYLAILVLMRFMPRRTGGELAIMDLVFVLLIANAAANALGDYSAVPDGLVLVATFMAWNYALNYLSFRFPFIERLTSPQPLQIVRKGKLLRRNMRREFITEEELMDHLRQEGITAVADVDAAFLEGDGKISVISSKRQRR